MDVESAYPQAAQTPYRAEGIGGGCSVEWFDITQDEIEALESVCDRVDVVDALSLLSEIERLTPTIEREITNVRIEVQTYRRRAYPFA